MCSFEQFQVICFVSFRELESPHLLVENLTQDIGSDWVLWASHRGGGEGLWELKYDADLQRLSSRRRRASEY
jgi:hypothetical protein